MTFKTVARINFSFLMVIKRAAISIAAFFLQEFTSY